jgi:transcriptional regulator with XRE-family HTH domain
MAPERLVLLRQAHALSQHDLATILGVRQNYISLLESGKKHPSEALLQRLAAYFRVEVAVLFLPPSPAGCTRQAS